MMHIVQDHSIGVTYVVRGLHAAPGGWWEADECRAIFDSCLPKVVLTEEWSNHGAAFRYDEVSIIEVHES